MKRLRSHADTQELCDVINGSGVRVVYSFNPNAGDPCVSQREFAPSLEARINSSTGALAGCIDFGNVSPINEGYADYWEEHNGAIIIVSIELPGDELYFVLVLAPLDTTLDQKRFMALLSCGIEANIAARASIA